MADPTYQPKVYMEQGGDRQVVKSGGEIKIETGGKIVPNSGTQAAAIADVAASDPLAAPAGGSGATAGAYDTAGNRDLMIAAVNDNRTQTIEIKADLDAIKAALRGAGILAP